MRKILACVNFIEKELTQAGKDSNITVVTWEELWILETR